LDYYKYQTKAGKSMNRTYKSKKKIFAVIIIAFILLAASGCSDDNRDVEINELNEKISELYDMINEVKEMINNFDFKIDVVDEVINSNNDVIEIVDDKLEDNSDSYYETSDYIVISGEQRSKELTRLELERPITKDDFEKLKYMVNLEYLYIPSFLFAADSIVRDIHPLAGLTSLSVLSIGNWEIRDISALAEMTNLTELTIWGSSARDISVLTGLTNLKTLTFGSEVIRDLTQFTELTNLSSLTIRLGSAGLRDLSPLSELTNLTTLTIERVPGINTSITSEHIAKLREALPNTEIIMN